MLDEIQALSRPAFSVLISAERLQEKVAVVEENLERARHDLAIMIDLAMERGVTAKMLAHQTGLPAHRIYKLRAGYRKATAAQLSV